MVGNRTAVHMEKFNSVGVRDGLRKKRGWSFCHLVFMTETFHLEFKRTFFTIQMKINRRVFIWTRINSLWQFQLCKSRFTCACFINWKICREKKANRNNWVTKQQKAQLTSSLHATKSFTIGKKVCRFTVQWNISLIHS